MNVYSVVIPMYNSENTIKESLESILNQTKFDLIEEIIVVDDGSTDDSVNVVKQFIQTKKCSKIKLILKKNGGAASARNIGIRSCKNKWIALLDADDAWEDKKIEIQDSILTQYSNIKALGTNRVGEKITHGEKVDDILYKISPFHYCIKNWPCTPSLIFDKSVFEEEEYFDESLSHAEEGIFFLDLANKTGLYYTTEVLVNCGNGKPTFGHSGLSGNIKKMHLGVLKVMKKAYEKQYISGKEYAFACVWETIKYMRRNVLVQFRRKSKGEVVL